ncbi:hypothetical protein TWF730_006357 [Orbilia blumenaviensis]|uniref:F-box domain-containing protein n=1 Tax=Orbilia blumenaviensis TaxID=1796055 RepID=A0AAV9VE12_9PEZI
MSLPPEIWLSVVSELPRTDLASFSLCCKAFRNLAVPILFRSIKLCDDSIAGFKAGGTLADMASYVRHLTFEGIDIEVTETVRWAQRCFEDLSQFPNITSIRINIAIIFELKVSLFGFIFRKLSCYQWYETLKKLDYEFQYLSPEEYSKSTPSAGSCVASTVNSIFRVPKDSPKAARIWNNPEMFDFWDYGVFIAPAFPPALEEVIIKVPGYLSSIGVGRKGRGPFCPSETLSTCANTLRKVDICISNMEFKPLNYHPPPQCPNVTVLTVYTRFKFIPTCLEELAARFPNVEFLDLGSGECLPISAYAECRGFEKVKEMRAPWPTRNQWDTQPLEEDEIMKGGLAQFWGLADPPTKLKRFEITRIAQRCKPKRVEEVVIKFVRRDRA